MEKSGIEILIENGLNQKFLVQLDEFQINELAIFALDHSNHSDLLMQLKALLSLELMGKKGATLLVNHGIANQTQLKNISMENVKLILEEYNAGDEQGARILLKEAILSYNTHDFSGRISKHHPYSRDHQNLSS